MPSPLNIVDNIVEIFEQDAQHYSNARAAVVNSKWRLGARVLGAARREEVTYLVYDLDFSEAFEILCYLPYFRIKSVIFIIGMLSSNLVGRGVDAMAPYIRVDGAIYTRCSVYTS